MVHIAWDYIQVGIYSLVGKYKLNLEWIFGVVCEMGSFFCQIREETALDLSKYWKELEDFLVSVPIKAMNAFFVKWHVW